MSQTAPTPSLKLTPELARRFAVARQHLADADEPVDRARLLSVIRDLGCLQLDPTNAVARSHLLVLWSRLGHYDPARLDALLWQERALFEYWAHAASIVLTEDYPIHHLMMRRYAQDHSPWQQRVRAWMEQNAVLRDTILDTLAERGPLPSRAFPDTAAVPWESSGWTSSRNVERMLAFLWGQGKVMVAGRTGGQRIWDLAERHLPAWTPRDALSESEIVWQAAEKALRALGIATPAHIAAHFTRDRYPGLDVVLAAMEAQRRIVRVQIDDGSRGWPGPWYVHAGDLPALDRLAAGDWQPRTTLLSPFDNLICDRARTETLFGFTFRLEIYVPRAQRQYGYYVMPILHGDRLIGRVDPRLDRKGKRLVVQALHLEAGVRPAPEVVRAVEEALTSLAAFLGAGAVDYDERVPVEWRR